jgi:hypothetical protein
MGVHLVTPSLKSTRPKSGAFRERDGMAYYKPDFAVDPDLNPGGDGL